MTSKVGRPSNPVEWIPVSYNQSDYYVGKIKFNDSYIYSIIDAEDYIKIGSSSWHVVTGAYIGTNRMIDGKKKTLYLHNHIMNRDAFLGRGQETTLDHLNGIGFDNRKVNLREISQSLQNINTRQRMRKITNLPDGLQPSDIPRNIWYIPPNGGHGERFAVEFKGIPLVGDIVKKTSSSKEISTRQKLQHAIEIRDEILEENPVLQEYTRTSERSIQLRREYDTITEIAKATFL